MTFDKAVDVVVYAVEAGDIMERYEQESWSYEDPRNATLKLLEELRKEYAPTIQMTMDQYTGFAVHRNNAVKRVDKVGILEFMSAYSELMDDFDHLTLMRAWVNPELIKVVD